MISIQLLVALLAGSAIMCCAIAFQMKLYSVRIWKCFPVSVALILTGVWGSELWYFVENGSFGGRSFFGAIFFTPLVFLLIAIVFRMPYMQTLDFIPSAGCLTLALVKLQCLRDHCCQGRILYVNKEYIYVRFPSQIVEMVNFLLLAMLFMLASRKVKYRGKLFPCFLILYGFTRFVLNSFRGELTPYALGLPAGHFWSLLSILAGIGWLIGLRQYSDRKQ